MTYVNYALSTLGAVCTVYAPHGTYVPARAIDGDDLTYARQATQHYLAHVTVDLGQVRTISRMRFLTQAGSSNIAETFKIQACDDGVNWLDIASYSRTGTEQIEDFTAQSYRHWRVQSLTGNGSYEYCYTIEWIGDDEDQITLEWTHPPVPTSGQLDEWLAHLDENYVPTIAAYLAAN